MPCEGGGADAPRGVAACFGVNHTWTLGVAVIWILDQPYLEHGVESRAIDAGGGSCMRWVK